jgi:hypothetical protein
VPAAGDPLLPQDLGERPGPVARLARQAQILKEVPAELQRRGAGYRVALVAYQECRVAARSDDEDRFLEARVESGEVRNVRAVLTIGVDDESVVAAGLSALSEAPETRGVERAWQLRHRLRHAEVGQLDRFQIRLESAM